MNSESSAQNRFVEDSDVKEAIILADASESNSPAATPGLPKCMLLVAGRPFLSFVVDNLRMQGIERFIFVLGYQANLIEKYLEESYSTLDYVTVAEEEGLGTGGAIQLASTKATTNSVLISSGHILFKTNLGALKKFHFAHPAECTIALKAMKEFGRYPTVDLDENGFVKSFKKKGSNNTGLINGGFYLLNITRFLQHSWPEKFFFETDYLAGNAEKGILAGVELDGEFLDMGIAEDFKKAQIALEVKSNNLKSIDKSWTLFLDRDGVINVERPGKYVLNQNEFIFSEGALEALRILAARFDRIILITNQRGIGKGLMTENDLQQIHKEMQRTIVDAGGRIDKIYYCSEVDSKCFDGKPNPGMALQALKDFQEIDFSKTIMVGNKPSDMRFGRSLGMVTAFITSTNPDQPFPHPDIDLRYNSLLEFTSDL